VERSKVDDRDGIRATIAIGAKQLEFEFNFNQAHNLVNALAAIGTAHALGVEMDALVEGARNVNFSELRGEQIELSSGVVVINDCYNANPISMRAAIDHLAEVASRRHAGRAVAVLGEMAELGPRAPEFHREIGQYAASRGVGAVLAVGELGAAYADGYRDAGELRTAADAEQAVPAASELINPGDVVLVKGSRSVGLERVSENLVRQDAGDRG
jgi:UDP-N-acetylmuramoyl-tripeptide--D-alanyl-D-alanine ligase